MGGNNFFPPGNNLEHFQELQTTLMHSSMPILKEIGTKFKLQNVNRLKKKDLVLSIILRIEEVMKIKYQPKSKDDFKRIAKMVLDSILPSLNKTSNLSVASNQRSSQNSSQFSSQNASGNSFSTTRSVLRSNSNPMDQLKLINLNNCICWGNPIGSNLLINCKNLLPHPPVQIYGSPVPNKALPTSPYACPMLYHHGCHPYPKKDLDTFQCPRCQILTNDPLHQIFSIFYEPILMFQKHFTLTFKLSFTQFTQISKNQDFGVEIRCLKLDGKHFFEQTWPDKMSLKVNGKLVKEVKALHHNSSLKKRRDEKYLARFGWKMGQNKVEIVWDNVYDGKNSKLGAQKLWNGKGIPYVVAILGVQKVGISGIMDRVVYGGLPETSLQNAIIIEENSKLPKNQQKALIISKPPEELSYVENYDDKWKRILCVSTGGLYGVGRRLTIEESKIFIRNRFREGSEGGELGISEIKVDLLCKITYTMIQYPARGVNCTHLDCFNLKFFLQTMENNAVRKWICPLCRKKCTQFVIDTYLEYILKILAEKDDMQEKVFFKSDASFSFEGVHFDSSNIQAETKQAASQNTSLQPSGKKTGPVSKTGPLPQLSSQKKGRKKKKDPIPEIDIMSIISSDDNKQNEKNENPVMNKPPSLAQTLSHHKNLTVNKEKEYVLPVHTTQKPPDEGQMAEETPSNVNKTNKNPEQNQHLGQEQSDENDEDEVDSQNNAPSHKSINQLLNTVKPLEGPISRTLSRRHSLKSRPDLILNMEELTNATKPPPMDNEQRLASHYVSPTKVTRTKKKPTPKKAQPARQKINISHTESKITSMSPLSKKPVQRTTLREVDISSIQQTDFMPPSDLCESNIIRALPEDTDKDMEVSQNQIMTANEQENKDNGNKSINSEKVNRVGMGDDTLLGSGFEETGEYLNAQERLKLDKELQEQGIEIPPSISHQQKNSTPKSNQESQKGNNQKEVSTLKSSSKMSKRVSSSQKRQKKSKTSNLTPQKPEEPLMNRDDLSITLTKDKSSISIRGAPRKKSVNSKNSQQNNSISPIKGKPENKITSKKKKPESVSKSMVKSKSKQGLLSLDKSQNVDINLDEYSPITVGFSSRLKQGNLDLLAEKESKQASKSKSRSKQKYYEDHPLDKSFEKTPEIGTYLGKRGHSSSAPADIPEDWLNEQLRNDRDYQEDKLFLTELLTLDESKKSKFSDSENQSDTCSDSNEKGWFSWNQEFQAYKKQQREMEMKLNLLHKFVKNRAEEPNSAQNAQINKVFYKLAKSLHSHNFVYEDSNYLNTVQKKIKRGKRNDTDLYKGLLSHYKFDQGQDMALLNIKGNLSLSDVLKGSTMDSAIEIL